MPADLGSSSASLAWGSVCTKAGLGALPWLPHSGNDWFQTVSQPTSKKFKSPGWPWVNMASWGKLANKSIPRMKPGAICGCFFTLEMKLNHDLPNPFGHLDLPSIGCLHWASFSLEEILRWGGCDIKITWKVKEIQVPGGGFKLASYQKSQSWR